jgi:hypothetical protein
LGPGYRSGISHSCPARKVTTERNGGTLGDRLFRIPNSSCDPSPAPSTCRSRITSAYFRFAAVLRDPLVERRSGPEQQSKPADRSRPRCSVGDVKARCSSGVEGPYPCSIPELQWASDLCFREGRPMRRHGWRPLTPGFSASLPFAFQGRVLTWFGRVVVGHESALAGGVRCEMREGRLLVTKSALELALALHQSDGTATPLAGPVESRNPQSYTAVGLGSKVSTLAGDRPCAWPVLKAATS